MTAAPPSPAALRRKIERLEAEIESLRETHRKIHQLYADMLAQHVDHEIRIQQAIKILQGEEK